MAYSYEDLKFSVSETYNFADLTVVQKTIIETRPQGDTWKAVAKAAGCPQIAVCSISKTVFLLQKYFYEIVHFVIFISC